MFLVIIQKKGYCEEDGDDILGLYDKVLELNPKYLYSSDCHFNKGILLQKLNKLGEVLECYDKAIEIDENCLRAYFLIR